MKPIIVLGDLNVDLIFSGLKTAPALGCEILAKGYRLKIGGSAANTACILALAGCPVRFYATVGDDFFGHWLRGSLGTYGLDAQTVRLMNGHCTGTTVVLTYPDDRMYITNAGTVATASLDDMPDGYLSGGVHLHLAAYFLQKNLRPKIGDLIYRAKMSGMTTSLDPGHDPAGKWDLSALASYWRYLDWFMPNTHELKSIAGTDELERAIVSFPPPAVKGVVVKDGAQGALLRYNGKLDRYPTAGNVNVVDTSCAGDCFNAGFLLALNRGESLETTVRLGNKYGATAVNSIGLPETLPN